MTSGWWFLAFVCSSIAWIIQPRKKLAPAYVLLKIQVNTVFSTGNAGILQPHSCAVAVGKANYTSLCMGQMAKWSNTSEYR